ncbi:hypothetical protein LTR16_011051, partial [Cryomyces antarcticus]
VLHGQRSPRRCPLPRRQVLLRRSCARRLRWFARRAHRRPRLRSRKGLREVCSNGGVRREKHCLGVQDCSKGQRGGRWKRHGSSRCGDHQRRAVREGAGRASITTAGRELAPRKTHPHSLCSHGASKSFNTEQRRRCVGFRRPHQACGGQGKSHREDH